MENPDIGEHEDVDVKNERQKVFNLMNSTSVQEPPVVLVQVSSIYLMYYLSNFMNSRKIRSAWHLFPQMNSNFYSQSGKESRLNWRTQMLRK